MTSPQAAVPSRHDFHDPRPLPPAMWKALTQWTNDSFHLTQEMWPQSLLSPVTLKVDGIDTLDLREALALIPQPALGVHLRIGSVGIPGILALSQRQGLGLLADMLGERNAEWPAARDLTDLEESLLGMLFQQLASAFSESWPGVKPVSCHFDSFLARPHRTRLFLPDATIIVARLGIQSRFGQENAFWLLPMDEAEQLLRLEGASADGPATGPSTILEDLALELPIGLVAELGRTQVKMSDIAALRAGDVLVLDQSISRSLPVYVGDKIKFRAHPGRVGSRQALVIESAIGDVRE